MKCHVLRRFDLNSADYFFPDLEKEKGSSRYPVPVKTLHIVSDLSPKSGDNFRF